MGAVSIAALLAGARVVGTQTATAAPQQQTTPAANSTKQTSANSSSTSSASACQVRCNRRCSYPGHCRRYTDSNKNGRCDLGECL
jgi:hypothetical protein